MSYHMPIGDRRRDRVEDWSQDDWSALYKNQREYERFIFVLNREVHYIDCVDAGIPKRRYYVEFPSEEEAVIFKLTHL